MDDNATMIELLWKRAEDYAKTSIEWCKLIAIERSADLVSSLASRLLILSVLALSFFFLNLGLAFWLGELFGASFYGFLAVGCFYAVMTIPIYALRKRIIKRPVSNAVIKELMEDM